MRSSLKGLVVSLAIATFTIGGGLLIGTLTSFGLGLIIGLTVVSFAIHGGWSLAEGMEAFARRIPADPNTTVSPGGHVELRWPSLGLRVEGRARLIKKIRLEAVAGGVPLSAELHEASELADRALDQVGIEPADELRAEAPA